MKRSLLVGLILAAPLAAAPDAVLPGLALQGRDLAEVLPGDHHVAVLARPSALRRDMPAEVTAWLLDRPAARRA